jgi:2,4-dienoyl-CoA reductase-like NADH-dependent reductase (Old Yellow Enzyme family)
MKIAEKLILPCGVALKNRICKSAMSENMGTIDHLPNKKFENVYEKWAMGGSALNFTGNVMVDARHIGEPGNIVIDKNFKDFDLLKRWVKAGTLNNTQLWMQINHPGKQSPKFLNKTPVSPSAIKLKAPLDKIFNPPSALTEIEILDIIERFVYVATVAKDSGFTGVQIHGAHGYLVSQFLSPLHNQRFDQWGGSLENRMRFVIAIYQGMRKELGNDFPISIKLNSADFQKGGFTEEESMKVVQTLAEQGIDLIEISGGTYESPEMTGVTRQQSTIDREAYFTSYCDRVRSITKTPIMLTGGFRTEAGMELALKNNSCDLIGLGRSVALNPNFPNELLSRKNTVSSVKRLTTGIKAIDKLFPLEIIWYTNQIHRMGEGKNPDPRASVIVSVLHTIGAIGLQGLKRVRAK